MVFIIQVVIFIITTSMRSNFLSGKHLRFDKTTPRRLGSRIEGDILRHIGIQQTNGIPFVIRTERWYHRALKAIGIATEIRIKNEDFDKKYFISTDFPNHLEYAINSADLLKHFQDLFTLPVKTLYAAPNAIWCVIKKEDRNKPDEYFARHFQILEHISNICTNKISETQNLSKTSQYRYWAFLVICIHFGLFMLGLVGKIPTEVDSISIVFKERWFIAGIIFGAIFAVGWLFYILFVFRGTSWVCWVLADFILFGIVGFLLSGIWMVREANHLLPQRAATEFTEQIVKKECVLHCKRRSRRFSRVYTYAYDKESECSMEARALTIQQKQIENYRCGIKAWYVFNVYTTHWKGSEYYSFKSSNALFDQTQIGSTLEIPVNPGALGLEWVDVNKIRPE